MISTTFALISFGMDFVPMFFVPYPVGAERRAEGPGGDNLSHFYWLIQSICSISDLEHKNASLWDRGAGFQLKGTKRYFDDFLVDQNRIWCIERGVAGVRREIRPALDLPISKRKLRPNWLKISKRLRTKLDGEWTARSFPVLNGVFESALLFLSK